MEDKQESKSRNTFWDEINPLWMFRCHPSEFGIYGSSICPGVFWPNGFFALLGLHFACFQGFITNWSRSGYNSLLLLYLLPVGVLWLILGAADIKFRRQKPTRVEMEGFDRQVVNWIGYVCGPLFPLVLLAAFLYVIWLSLK